MRPTAHTMYIYKAPEAPPFGNDQMRVRGTYCQTAPVTEAKPIKPHGPKYRCINLSIKMTCDHRKCVKIYLQLLHSAHARHIPRIRALELPSGGHLVLNRHALRWKRHFAQTVKVSDEGGRSWRAKGGINKKAVIRSIKRVGGMQIVPQRHSLTDKRHAAMQPSGAGQETQMEIDRPVGFLFLLRPHNAGSSAQSQSETAQDEIPGQRTNSFRPH